jgi:hypothetical protein
MIKISGGALVEVLTPSFETAAKPRVSFDAAHILFVGRKESSHRFSVWQMMVDGKEPHEVVGCEGNCLQAEWLSTLYTLDDAAPSRRIAFACLPDDGGPPTIFTSRLDGTDRRPITFTPLGAVDPIALPDGRLFFRNPAERTDQMRGEEKKDFAGSFAVHIDGTDLSAFTAAEALPRRANSEVAHSTTDSANIDETHRFRPRLSDGRRLESRTIEQTNSKGLAAVDPATGLIEVLYDSAEWDEFDPVAVVPREEPAGHSSVVRDSAKADLYCMDASLTEGTTLAKDGVRRVRVFEAETRATSLSERSLGEAAIEDDGSFFIEVPARTPIRLELLGKDGEVLRGMKNWTWVMPGERRGCIGCHEDRQLAPPNRHVLALRKPAQKLRLPDTTEISPSSPIQVRQREQP